MAKKVVHKFKRQFDYNYRNYRTDLSNDTEYNLKVTEPGQAVSIKKLVERYEKNKRRISDFGTL